MRLRGALLAALGLLAVNVAAQTAGEGELLLSLPAAIPSWDTALASTDCQAPAGADWETGTLPCGATGGTAAWRGVTCNQQGAVIGLNLSSCGLQGTLPPKLAQLQQLRTLDLSSNQLSGVVPQEWTAAGAFPALESLRLGVNQLSGGLDDFNMQAGGFIASKLFNVSGNGLNESDIPETWYSPTLVSMDISNNGVSGPMPAQWADPVNGQRSAFPSLKQLYIQGNNLSGIADPWGGGTTVFDPAFLCIGDPGNPLLEMAPPPLSDDAQVLQAFKAAIPNLDDALANSECSSLPGAAWEAGSMPCGSGATGAMGAMMPWRGVTCDAQGDITALSLPGCGLEGTLPAALAQLVQLKDLDLSGNALTGSIPQDWTVAGAFTALEKLQLADNQLSGGLDDFNMEAEGFIASLYFNVSKNNLNQSTIPAGWYSNTLALMDISHNDVSGPLPAEWGEPKAGHAQVYPSAFPALERLALEGNNLSGPGDPWPRGAANTFAPSFYCTAMPGNELLEMAEPPTSSTASSGLSAGAIAGIVVGSLAAVALVAALVVLAMRRRKAKAKAAEPVLGVVVTKGGTETGSSSDVEGGGGKLMHGSSGEGFAMGSAYEGKPPAGFGGLPAVVQTDSGRTFGTMLVDTDARRLPPTDWNTVLFSELEMDTCIGQGSFGAVWRAKYCSTSVAVKMLGQDKSPSASDTSYQRKITRQLEKEAGIMSKLRHTNICLYMGACLEPPCLLMEYCARKSVDSLLAQGLRDAKAAKQLSWPRLLSMASDAAKGMVYLHSRQPAVYHRDLKSANLLVTSQWQVKVADFNLSRALETTDFMSSLCIQNPRWLAPEVLEGGAGGLPADVWAFGTVLWELMTWKAPFGGANPYQIINTVQAASSGSGLVVPGPEELPAGTLGEYAAFVELMQCCWERDPSRRPTFETLASRLREILQAEMQRNGSSSSQLGSANRNSLNQPSPQLTATSPPLSLQPTVVSAVSSVDAGLQAALASNAGSHGTFEEATQATSRAFQEAMRDSAGSQPGEASQFAAAAAEATQEDVAARGGAAAMQ